MYLLVSINLGAWELWIFSIKGYKPNRKNPKIHLLVSINLGAWELGIFSIKGLKSRSLGACDFFYSLGDWELGIFSIRGLNLGAWELGSAFMWLRNNLHKGLVRNHACE